MKELMSEPLDVNRYNTWLPNPLPPRRARIVETSLRDDHLLPDSIYNGTYGRSYNGTSSYGRASTPPPSSSYWRGSHENVYDAIQRGYSSYDPNHFRNYRRSKSLIRRDF